MLVIDYITGRVHIFSFEIPEPFDPTELELALAELKDSIGEVPTVEVTTAQFHAETIEKSCYVKITDNGIIAINPGVLSRMPEEKIVTVRHSGPLAITGAVSPEGAYDEITDGYREFSIYKSDSIEATITVYEKPLKNT